MSYETLARLYHRAPSEVYKKEFMIRSESPSTIKIPLKVRGKDKEQELFVLVTVEMMNKLCNIYKLNNRFENYLSILSSAAIEHYKKGCLVEEILKTNEIEGVRSTRKEIKDVLENKGDKFKRFYGLVKKYSMLMNGVKVPLETVRDIRDLYDEIVLEEIEISDYPDGMLFRKEAVNVMSASQKVIHTGVLPEEKIIVKLNELLNFLNYDSCEPLIKIAIIHYYFGYIHPFYDGNGRVSRFISSYLLSEVLNSAISFKLSISIRKNIDRYYRGFTDVNNILSLGDATPFCLMFLDIIEESLNEGISELEDKIKDIDYYFCIFEQMREDEEINKKEEDILFILAQVELFGDGYMSIQDLIKYMSVGEEKEISETTVRKYLKSILEKEYIQESRKGRKKVYSLDKRFTNEDFS